MNRKPLLLIADDDFGIRAALSARLVQAGFETVCAPDTPTAIAQFDRRRPDAAIVDIQMPGSDGLAICEHIRSIGSDIPVFVLTGANARIIRDNLDKLTRAVGATHFVTKPYDGKALVTMVTQAVQSVSLM